MGPECCPPLSELTTQHTRWGLVYSVLQENTSVQYRPRRGNALPRSRPRLPTLAEHDESVRITRVCKINHSAPRTNSTRKQSKEVGSEHFRRLPCLAISRLPSLKAQPSFTHKSNRAATQTRARRPRTPEALLIFCACQHQPNGYRPIDTTTKKKNAHHISGSTLLANIPPLCFDPPFRGMSTMNNTFRANS